MITRAASTFLLLLAAVTLAGCSAPEPPAPSECLTAIERASTAEDTARTSSQTLSTVLSDAATKPPAEFASVASAATAWASDLDALAAGYDALAPLTVESFGDAALQVSSTATSAAEQVREFAAAAQAYSVGADDATIAALNAAAAEIAPAPGAIADALDRVSEINTNSDDICD